MAPYTTECRTWALLLVACCVACVARIDERQSSLTVDSGDHQTAVAGAPLAKPLVVRVQNSLGQVMPGIQIFWTVSGGGTLRSATSTTSGGGLASNALTLGATVGASTVTAAIADPPVSVTFTAMPVDTTVTLDIDPAGLTVASDFLGLSYERGDLSHALLNPGNAALIALFHQLGPGVLRLVGDSLSNTLLWSNDPAAPCGHYGTINPCDLDALAGFLRAANWKVIYGVPLVNRNPDASGASLSVANPPDNAADEAQVAAQKLGDRLWGFEIGNEPDSYIKPSYGNPAKAQIVGYLYSDYISPTQGTDPSGAPLPSWPAIADAIQNRVQGAVLTGPATGYEWDLKVAQTPSIASRVSLLTRHYYAGYTSSQPPPSINALLAPDYTNLLTTLPEVAEAAASAKIPGGYRISECNSISAAGVPGQPTGVANAFAAALWTVDFSLTAALNRSVGVTFHGGGDPLGTYSPVLDDGAHVVGIGADYYGMLALSTLTRGGTLLTTQVQSSGGTFFDPGNWATLVSSTTPSTFSGYPHPSSRTALTSTFSAYAILEPDGSSDVVLSNKDPALPHAVAIHSLQSVSQASTLLLTAPSLASLTGFTLGGEAVALDGSWHGTSAAVFLANGQAVVVVPPGSAQFVHLTP